MVIQGRRCTPRPARHDGAPLVGQSAPPIAATLSLDCGRNGFLDLVDEDRARTASLGALGFLSKTSTRFFYEVMPVALASVIGTILVNHYSQPATPAVVVAPAQASADSLIQSLHEEHELIVDYLKRKQEAEATRLIGAQAARAPIEAPLPPVFDNRPQKLRSGSAEKPAPRPAPKPAPEPKVVAHDPLPLGPDLASLPPPDSPPYPRVIAANVIVRGSRMAGAFRDWVVGAAEFPARAAAARFSDDSPRPPRLIPMVGAALSPQD